MINVEHNKRYSPGHLLLNCFWALVFGYFALRIDSDPEWCEASDENDYKFTTGVNKAALEHRYVDVGSRFRLVFEVAFFSYLTMAVIGTATYLASSDGLRQFMFLILALLNYAVAFAWIFGFYVRMQHSGKVCSGDFLSESDSRDGILVQQGIFLKYAMVSFIVIFGIAVALVLFKLVR